MHSKREREGVNKEEKVNLKSDTVEDKAKYARKKFFIFLGRRFVCAFMLGGAFEARLSHCGSGASPEIKKQGKGLSATESEKGCSADL